MKTKTITRFLPSLAALALLGASPALHAQDTDEDLFRQEIERAFTEQMEQFSKLFEKNPKSKEQFEKGLEKMKRALEEGASNPGEPLRFEYQWEGHPSEMPSFEEFFQRSGPEMFDGLRLFPEFGADPGLFQRLLERGGDLSFAPFPVEPLEIPELSKNHKDELAKFRPVVAEARESTVQFLAAGNQVALGTVITEDGYALTKFSEFARRGNVFEAKLSDGRLVPALMVERIPEFDLALVKLNATGLKPASFSDADLPIGSFLAAPSIGEDPAAVGVLSVQPRILSPKKKGYLGIALQPGDARATIGGVTIGSPAERAGLVPGDTITTVDGDPVGSAAQLVRAISSKAPSKKVHLTYLRDGREKTTSAQLRSRNDIPEDQRNFRKTLDMTRRLGANVNRHRGGYPTALQHDLPLNANQAGGPLVNLDGEIIGINIARAGRVSSYALPASAIMDIINDLNLDDRPAEASTVPELPEIKPADIDANFELESAEREIERARAVLRKAEQRANEARQRLRPNGSGR